MATAKVKVVLNTASPEVTKDEIVSAFKSQDANAVVDIVRDSFGKVVAVYLDNVLPAAAETARAAVLANKGVATISPVIPKQLFISDLNDLTGIAWSGTFANAQQLIEVGDPFGVNLGSLTITGYTDYAEVPEGVQVALNVAVFGAAGLTIEPGSISLNANGLAAPIVLANSAQIVVPAVSGVGQNGKAYWIDQSGKLYLMIQAINGVWGQFYTFEEAVANGAV